ncbi:MAG: D-tyrosyl-tRNA(Tyr) deacylase [Sphaerochaetaceae bacterium]|nr:D-tyrosyl-tRNA(Tyr) deacylase [Sphaerochaetaceae bacterium]
MKAVIQTVKNASVSVNGMVTGSIDEGMLCYFGVEKHDTEDMLIPFLEKLLKLRIFKDENGKTNLDLASSGGKLLFISQFTLASNIYRGNRPSFDSAMTPDRAKEFYENAIIFLRSRELIVETGVFGAHMQVSYVNDGPETFVLESDKFLNKK